MSPGFKVEKHTVFGEPARVDQSYQARSHNEISGITILTVPNKDSIE